MTTSIETEQVEASTTTRFLALDLTRACQATCDHCYNSSGPSGTAGSMTREDWLNVLDQAVDMGVTRIQFIGGEATLHPDLAELVTRAIDRHMSVEVFSNMINVRPALWPVLRQRGVSLATSYYSNHADEHEAITHHRGSYGKTKNNIMKALSFGIPVRAALVDVLDGQRIEEAKEELRALGVTDIRTDHVRGIGRGARENTVTDPSELCGHCTKGRAAILPDGSVGGCVMSSGMMTAGNVLRTPLAAVIDSQAWRDIAARVPQPKGRAACVPDSCTPKQDSCQPSPGGQPSRASADPWTDFRATACNPDNDGSDCSPAESDACGPSY